MEGSVRVARVVACASPGRRSLGNITLQLALLMARTTRVFAHGDSHVVARISSPWACYSLAVRARGNAKHICETN
jgi:hypothetical protein